MMSVQLYMARRWWDAKRFGLSPDKLSNRLVSSDGPKILCVTIPKAGTHLLERALCLHRPLYRKTLPTIHGDNVHQWGNLSQLLSRLGPGQIIMSHLHFSRERWEHVRAHDIKCIFMIRDPRDIVVSQAYYILRERRHRNHQLFKRQESFRACLSLSISGHEATDLLSIGQTLTRFEGWLQTDALVVRFEDLVGSKGEGDDDTQFRMLKNIYDHVGVDLGPDTLVNLANRTFSNRSPTFNNGVSGRWRDYFDESLKQMFKDSVGDALVTYGYERDTDW